jgi:hypothetical protein
MRKQILAVACVGVLVMFAAGQAFAGDTGNVGK